MISQQRCEASLSMSFLVLIRVFPEIHKGFFFYRLPLPFTVINLMWTFKRLTAMFTSLKEAVQGIRMKLIKKASPSST